MGPLDRALTDLFDRLMGPSPVQPLRVCESESNIYPQFSKTGTSQSNSLSSHTYDTPF